MKVIINANIYDYNSYRENMYIVFNKEIIEIDKMSRFNANHFVAAEIIDVGGKLIIPGFVNGHTHIYSTFARGLNLPFNPTSFQDILDQLWWKIDASIDRKVLKYSALMYGSESIENGVTTMIDHNASGEFIKGSSKQLEDVICKQLGLKGIFCYETSDRFTLEECIDENLTYSQTHKKGAAGLFGMHASMSLSDKSLKKIGKYIGKNPVHIHVAESEDDVKDSQSKSGMRVLQRLDKYNLLKEGSVLAHCVHVDHDEIQMIKDKNITIAVNTSSNLNNTVGLPDVLKFKNNGIRVIVGTDGLGSNIASEYVNLVHLMKNKYSDPCNFGLDQLKEIIEDGYKYVSETMGMKIGRFEKDYSADFQIYDYKEFTPMSGENIMAHLFYGVFMNMKPSDVLSNGKFVKRNGNVTVIKDIDFNEARNISEKFWRKVQRSESIAEN